MSDEKTKKFIFFLIFSFFLHLAVISGISLHIEGKTLPVIYNWSSIVNKDDLFISKKYIAFPKSAKMSLNRLRNDYFFPLVLMRPLAGIDKKKGELVYSAVPIDDSKLEIPDFGKNRGNKYLYLWERQNFISSLNEEKVSYNVYVSGQGQILLLYPEVLPVDSRSGLHLQAHIQKSAMFLNKRFSWTKLEEIVK